MKMPWILGNFSRSGDISFAHDGPKLKIVLQLLMRAAFIKLALQCSDSN